MRGLAAILLALGLALPASAASGGLRGIVKRGPITPVCREGVPCDAPAKHVVLTFRRNGISRSVTTGNDGRYLIRLEPGTWALRISSARFGYRPKLAFVRAGVVRTLNISIDTGIR